ncbi:hypothetical protein HDV04_005748 [Boothiomyces sp. JEL0838]|nr:hypothetical protein HDV04_005748 [Boothiomyces sp. JEL0838]
MGNGAKAAMKRERNAKDQKAGGKSQTKSVINIAAMNVKCAICMQTFLQTVKRKGLEEHINAKHSGKDVASCFPNFTD